ncbi:gram-negative porin family protein [Paraburkholderia xenovorans LB400]|uniref:Outer membrane porin, OmpC family n=1 Tax=Paraburkholderia xenovorans (strain LB400) TaxID=266265 RepID=Q13I67_PARXL|nr:porin [Paraburkholderia xenovorans]ABE36222.1 outer membrane porin, OmpC family [Paraburkholderia xenovorans LB400]AIP35036.1 gram-negative porin family protein [Paraburkholderia xenovorans LB400]
MRSYTKWLIQLCGATAIISSSAHAQSSVTLYGIIDEGIMYLSNSGGSSRTYLDSVNGIDSSRWGLKGSEDLGSGFRAIFQIESGINLNSGAFAQGGTPFGRQAYVGLSSAQYGSLTLGRQYDMIFYFPASISPVAIGSVIFGHPGDLDNTAHSLRVNNAVRYMSPNFGPFTFGGEYSVGGIVGNTTSNSGYSLGAEFANGPLTIAAAFEYFKNPTSATAGSGFFTGNSNGISPLALSLNSAYTSATAYQVFTVAGNYVIGPFTLMASGSQTEYANLGGGFAGAAARFRDVDVGVQYKATPSLFFALAYNYLAGAGVRTAAGSTVGNQHYHQLGAMADYIISKRTDIYFDAGWQLAKGTSSLGTVAVADISNQGDSSNNHQFLFRLTLRQKF